MEFIREHFCAIIFSNFRCGLSQECLVELKSLFSDKAAFCSTVNNWFNEFKRGSLIDEFREGPPKASVVTYLLTYLAITTCYRSWPQLICGAIRHELLQLGANFGYPAFLDSHQPVWPNAGEAVLVCDNHHLAQIRRLYELGWSYPYERHDPAIEDFVF